MSPEGIDPQERVYGDTHEELTNTMQAAVTFLAQQSAKAEDSAVCEYIRQQAAYLNAKGEALADYLLVCEKGTFTYDGGSTFKQARHYGLKHKDTVRKMEFPDE